MTRKYYNDPYSPRLTYDSTCLPPSVPMTMEDNSWRVVRGAEKHRPTLKEVIRSLYFDRGDHRRLASEEEIRSHCDATKELANLVMRSWRGREFAVEIDEGVRMQDSFMLHQMADRDYMTYLGEHIVDATLRKIKDLIGDSDYGSAVTIAVAVWIEPPHLHYGYSPSLRKGGLDDRAMIFCEAAIVRSVPRLTYDDTVSKAASKWIIDTPLTDIIARKAAHSRANLRRLIAGHSVTKSVVSYKSKALGLYESHRSKVWTSLLAALTIALTIIS